jgi:hypothetical protein
MMTAQGIASDQQKNEWDEDKTKASGSREFGGQSSYHSCPRVSDMTSDNYWMHVILRQNHHRLDPPPSASIQY